MDGEHLEFGMIYMFQDYLGSKMYFRKSIPLSDRSISNGSGWGVGFWKYHGEMGFKQVEQGLSLFFPKHALKFWQ